MRTITPGILGLAICWWLFCFMIATEPTNLRRDAINSVCTGRVGGVLIDGVREKQPAYVCINPQTRRDLFHMPIKD